MPVSSLASTFTSSIVPVPLGSVCSRVPSLFDNGCFVQAWAPALGPLAASLSWTRHCWHKDLRWSFPVSRKDKKQEMCLLVYVVFLYTKWWALILCKVGSRAGMERICHLSPVPQTTMWPSWVALPAQPLLQAAWDHWCPSQWRCLSASQSEVIKALRLAGYKAQSQGWPQWWLVTATMWSSAACFPDKWEQAWHGKELVQGNCFPSSNSGSHLLVLFPQCPH